MRDQEQRRSARARVAWSPRDRRPWCPGSRRPAAAEAAEQPISWTAYFKLDAVMERLRSRQAEAGGAQQGPPGVRPSRADGAAPAPEPSADAATEE